MGVVSVNPGPWIPLLCKGTKGLASGHLLDSSHTFLTLLTLLGHTSLGCPRVSSLLTALQVFTLAVPLLGNPFPQT
jgi:hypothetical protein